MLGELSSNVIALIPILFGAISRYFGLFVDSPNEFRRRMSLVEQSLSESLSNALMDIVNRVRAIHGTDELFRGDGRESPDVIAAYSQKQQRGLKLIGQLSRLRRRVRFGHNALLSTVIVGMAILVLNLVFSSYRNYLVFGAIGVFVMQVLTVIWVYRLGNRLEDYENFS